MRIIAILLLIVLVSAMVSAEAFSRQAPSCNGDICSFTFLYELLPAYVSALESVTGVIGVYNLGFGGSGVTYNSSVLQGDYSQGIQRWEDAQRVQYGMTMIAPDGLPAALCLLGIDGSVYGVYINTTQPQGSIWHNMIALKNDNRCPS